jgi:hypothetical protein
MRRYMKVELAAVIAIAGILIWLLLVKPVIGMADNGDFLRIMGTIGLDYTDPGMSYSDKYFGWFIRELNMKDMGLGGYATTSLVPVLLAKGLSWLFNGGVFDMRFVAVIYSLLFMAGTWLLLKHNKRGSPWVNGLMALLFVLIFADIGYSAYYNSLYSEPTAFVFMLLTLGFVTALLRRAEPMPFYLTGFIVSAVFLIGAKVQNAPVGILLALLCLRLSTLRKGDGWRRRTGWLALFLVVVSLATYFSLPKEIKIINQYQTVFYGVLKDSQTPEADLRELGLPEKLAVNAGTNYFEGAPIDQKDPVFAEEYYPHFSHAKVGLFYLKHPMRFLDKLGTAAENGMTIRPYYLGSFEKSEGLKAGENSYAFSFWSEFKHRVLPNKLWFIIAVFILYYAVLIRRYLNAFRVRDRIYLEVLAGIGMVGLFQFVTPVIGDGEADLAKHLFGFNVSFDLMIWVSLFWLADKAAGMLRLRVGKPSGRLLPRK